ncbi:glycosyltransferase family 4 protein [Chryseobacterium salivictor]|uniref:Glycogen synthase n=1 Tax=Chryseobacterium salivictor TaxID=2547600 RepID=A0A4P6ZEY6_9FLAO|nr:glycosyltransferase family 4 protein [Chryseobacterium salivictor]QBO58180.1 Glycogen synthase [Chryseobacterium salivictor]
MSSLQHVLILTREYYHPKLQRVGGTGVFNSVLAKELVKNGIKVSVFAVNKNTVSFDDQGVEVYSIKGIFERNFLLEFLRSVTGKIGFLKPLHFKIYEHEKKAIQKQLNNWIRTNNYKINLIETHDFEGMALCIDERIPYVIRCHGSWTVLEKYFNYKNVSQGRTHCEKLAFEKSRNNIVISNFSKRINERFFNIKNARLIYNGIDTDFFKPNATNSILAKSIFYLGNVSSEKGAELAIGSFLKVKKSFPESTLHFIGKVNLSDLYIQENIMKNNIQESVFFYGEKKKEEIVELISRAEIVYFPSKGENFSLSLLEVMAMGKPVICSDIDSFREIIVNNENGLIASGVSEFYMHTKKLFNDSELRTRLSENARETVVKQFDLKKMIQATISYYKEII